MTQGSFADSAGKIYENSGNRALLGALPPLRGRSVLDLGCGAGSNARVMTAAGAEVGCVTLSLAEARLCKESVRWVLIADLARPLPLHAATFDIVVMSHVLEHLIDPVGALNAVRSLLKSGGQIAIAVPSVTHYSVRLRLLAGDWTYTHAGILDWTHVKFFSRSGIVSVAAAAGYDVALEAHEGAFPLWKLRRFLPGRIVRKLNDVSARVWPDLFATQFVYLLKARNAAVERAVA